MFADWCPKSVNSIWLQTSVRACRAHCCQGAKASFLAPRWRNKRGYYHRLGCPAIGWQGTLLELWSIPNRATKSKVRGAATKSGSWGGYLLQTQRYSAVWYTHEKTWFQIQTTSEHEHIQVLKPRHCSSEHKFFRRSWLEQKARRWGLCEKHLKRWTMETLG